MNWFRLLLPALVTLSAINVAYLAWFDTYDFLIGPMHFVAHQMYKPILILGTAFYLTVLTRKPALNGPAIDPPHRGVLAVLLGALAIHWFAITAGLNALFDEWNYREYSSQLDISKLFTTAQIDAWYRPLGFLSLWIDSKIYGPHLWGYHIQNVIFHAANAFLVLLLARRIGLSERAGQWGALLYLGASSAYEPVMWPSARFDLMAMTFTGLALVWSIDFVRQGRMMLLAGAMGAYVLALFSKESGYALPIVLLPLLWPDRNQVGRAVRLLGAVGIVSIAMLALRFSVLQGLGGYAQHPGVGSPHLSITSTTFVAILTRTFPFSLLSLNQVAPMTVLARSAASLFALLLAAAVWSGASTTPKQRWVALYALIATLPVLTLISWLDPKAQHVRYVYMPAFFVMLFTACALSNIRNRWIAPAFLILGLTCGVRNVQAYKDTYARGDELAARISRDAESSAGASRAMMYGLPPDEFNGVLFSIFQLQYRLAQYQPKLAFAILERGADRSECSTNLCYEWDTTARDLQRIRP